MASRYSSAHQNPHGAGDQRPTAQEVISDEERTDNLHGKVVLITGCSSGIGVETARALFATGAELYLTARDVDKARKALPELGAVDRVHFLQLELNSLRSVQNCVQHFMKDQKKLNILVCNAGVMHTPFEHTVDGFEQQFGINFLAHFLLFTLLESALLSGVSSDFASRVVVVSSSGHRIAGVDFDDINFSTREYNGWLSYGQSKTACIYLANEIERRYGARGVHGLSLHPGSIFSGLQKTVPSRMRAQWKDENVLKVIKSPAQGASTSVFAAVARSLEGKGGLYLEDCSVSSPVKDGAQSRDPGYAPYAFDQEKAQRLWDLASEMITRC